MVKSTPQNIFVSSFYDTKLNHLKVWNASFTVKIKQPSSEEQNSIDEEIAHQLSTISLSPKAEIKKFDWSADYWKPGNHIFEFYKNRKWVKEVKEAKTEEQTIKGNKPILPPSDLNFKKFRSQSYGRFLKKKPMRKQVYKQLTWVGSKCIVASLPNYDEELGIWIDYRLLDKK